MARPGAAPVPGVPAAPVRATVGAVVPVPPVGLVVTTMAGRRVEPMVLVRPGVMIETVPAAPVEGPVAPGVPAGARATSRRCGSGPSSGGAWGAGAPVG